jgi:ferredoxin
VRVPRVTFEPLAVTVECEPGETIFACARRNGILIPTACNGKATCGLCRVKIVAGAESLPPLAHEETKHLGNTYFITKLRLSCQLRPTADVTVKIPDMPAPRKK